MIQGIQLRGWDLEVRACWGLGCGISALRFGASGLGFEAYRFRTWGLPIALGHIKKTPA